ncbi:MAG: hypothetical protein ACRDD9_06915 [Shewanella sp.]
MSLSIKERIALVKRAAEIHKAMQSGELKLTERIKLGKEKISVRRQLGFNTKKAEEPATPEVKDAEPALPEMVRKLRDGELAIASGTVIGDAVLEAEPYLSLSECVERAKEWAQKSGAVAA